MALTSPPTSTEHPQAAEVDPLDRVPLIPKERYISAAFAAIEAERLWPRVWQIACREEELPAVGSYVEYTICDQSILIVRSALNTIRAFHNACLHRGMQLKHGCGTMNEIRCPYHAWRYDLDGSVIEVIDEQDFAPPCVQRDSLRLRECLVDTWGGSVFVNMDVHAEPLLDYLRPIPELLARFKVEEMRLQRYRTTVIGCNWKTALDAFAEAYHFPGTHPQAIRWMDYTGYQYEQYGTHARYYARENTTGVPSRSIVGDSVDREETLLAMVGELSEADMYTDEEQELVNQLIETARGLPDDISLNAFFAQIRRQQAAAKGLDLSAFSDEECLSGHDWQIFPNVMHAVNAGNGFIFRFRPNGTDPHSCIWDVWALQRYGPDEEIPTLTREFYADPAEHDGWGTILWQDIVNLPNIQRGMQSTGFEGLRLGRQEDNIRNFHRVLSEYLANES